MRIGNHRLAARREGEFLLRVACFGLAAAAAGGAILLLPPLAYPHLAAGAILGAALALAAAAAGRGLFEWRALGILLLAALGRGALLQFGYGPAADAALGAALALALGRGRGIKTLAAMTAVFTVAIEVAAGPVAEFLGRALAPGLPSAFIPVAQSAAFGFFAAVAAAPLHLSLRADPVMAILAESSCRLGLAALTDLEPAVARYRDLVPQDRSATARLDCLLEKKRRGYEALEKMFSHGV